MSLVYDFIAANEQTIRKMPEHTHALDSHVYAGTYAPKRARKKLRQMVRMRIVADSRDSIRPHGYSFQDPSESRWLGLRWCGLTRNDL
ncbi:hypothetical protein PoB_003181100 [Plakobranchus ocellatus]|uniref:Uncharacterized protein n=1 Tax=Plakobranchus ocellatus TaxID=259542 RepID=A0AAV4A249_9GAST|nr:hypothetical protein PoB_003181100 [Plakobranchus ocellatus]